MVKRIIYIFIIAFILNFIWEHFHSLLYIHYKGGPITEFILLRASFFDAVVITILSYPFSALKRLKDKLWLMVLVALVFAAGLEIWALQTGRWEYRDVMPIIPIIKTGLTPTIQLGLLGYISVMISKILAKAGLANKIS